MTKILILLTLSIVSTQALAIQKKQVGTQGEYKEIVNDYADAVDERRSQWEEVKENVLDAQAYLSKGIATAEEGTETANKAVLLLQSVKKDYLMSPIQGISETYEKKSNCDESNAIVKKAIKEASKEAINRCKSYYSDCSIDLENSALYIYTDVWPANARCLAVVSAKANLAMDSKYMIIQSAITDLNKAVDSFTANDLSAGKQLVLKVFRSLNDF